MQVDGATQPLLDAIIESLPEALRATAHEQPHLGMRHKISPQDAPGEGVCFVQPTLTAAGIWGAGSSIDARIMNTLELRKCCISALRLFNAPALLGYMAEPEDVARDLHLIRLFMSTGIMNPLHHFTAHEWASLVSSGLGSLHSSSSLDLTPKQKLNIIYIMTDSGMMPHHKKKGGHSSMYPYMQTAQEAPHFRNVIIKCQHGGTFLDFNQWMEAILFAHGGGPEGWRAEVPGLDWVPAFGQPGHDPIKHLALRRQVWLLAVGPDVAMPDDIAQMTEILFVPPAEVAVCAIACFNDLADANCKKNDWVCLDWADRKAHFMGLAK